MPIVIEDMQTVVVPEREPEAPAPRAELAGRDLRRKLLETVIRELRIREERAARLRAD